MNIDEFLDGVEGGDDSHEDSIDLTSEDVSGVVTKKEPMETSSRPAEVVAPAPAPVAVEAQTTSLEAEAPTVVAPVPVPVAVEPAPPIQTTSPATPVVQPRVVNSPSPVVASAEVVKPALTENSSPFEIIKQINDLIGEKKLLQSLKSYTLLESAYDKFPESDITVKQELGKLKVQVYGSIEALRVEQKKIFVRDETKILQLIEDGSTYLKQRDVKSAIRKSDKIVSMFKSLPVGFTRKTEGLKNQILQFQLNLKTLRRELMEADVKKISADVKAKLLEVDSLVESKKLSLGQTKLSSAWTLYDKLSEQYQAGFESLHKELMRRKSTLDALSQIKNLSNDFKSGHNYAAKSVENLNASSPDSVLDVPVMGGDIKSEQKRKSPVFDSALARMKSEINSVKDSFEESDDFVKGVSQDGMLPSKADHLVAEKLKVNPLELNGFSFKKESGVKVVSVPKTPSVPHKPTHHLQSKLSPLDESLKKVKLSKVKVDLISQNYDSAYLRLLELQRIFPKDIDIRKEIESLLANSSFEKKDDAYYESLAEGEILEKRLDDVSEEIKSGYVEEAEKELIEIADDEKSSHDFAKVAEELEADAKLIEKNDSLKDIGKKIKKVKDEVANKLVNRRLVLAKHQIKAGNYDKAKGNLEFVLSKDGNNRAAKKLYNLIS